MSGKVSSSERQSSFPSPGLIFAALVVLAVLIWMSLPSVNGGPPAYKAQCNNNLKQLGVALHNYHAQNGCFPPAYIADAEGKPILSWRCFLMPYLVGGIRNHFLDPELAGEPWNSPGNRMTARTVVPSLICPEGRQLIDSEYARTDYVAVVGKGTAWPVERPLRLEEISDDPSTTILLVELADSDIAIMEPRDLRFEVVPMQVNPPELRGISSRHKGGVNVLMADGSVCWLSNDTPPDALRAMLTVSGGEKVDPKWLGL